ncbi:HAL/PAL/TAL family ammonia-lyase [Actinacidiphila yeochonensis]|uniref:HAL/PAL/TAL family ammonia-lyase n=1 Tax=Actinacidiphila yeochonensis TaxID=89050 RepID=UPI000B220685|nr:aromatic amino acid ammonia-lyase [Actinacidiphila yeochonensis]
MTVEVEKCDPPDDERLTEPAPRPVETRLDGRSVAVEEVAAAARRPGRRTFLLDEDAVLRMRDSVRLKDEVVAAGLPVYGVTSGFGDSARRQISARKVEALQANLIAGFRNGTGPAAAPDVVRATMITRANCLARGGSGIRPEVVALLLDCLNHDILPLIPEQGSVGASGDLVPLSYVGALLTGQGEVLHRGERRTAAAALAEAGLEPVSLASKEGLALVNGTSFMAGFAVLALGDAAELAFTADLCTALASQALDGNPLHFTAFVFDQKPHAGSVASARLVRRLLGREQEGAAVPNQAGHATGAMPRGAGFRTLERPIQDRYSIRCAPHVTGVLRDTLTWASEWTRVEINSSNDNPLFDTGAGVVVNGGNFYGGHIGQAMDALKTAVASVGDLLERQLQLAVDEKYNNGLTPNLIPRFADDDWEAGLHHGFKSLQLVASALTAEALKLTMPASSFSRSTEAHNQDKVSMGTIAARDARTVVETVRQVAAIHLLALCQAAELRGPDRLSPATAAALAAVRAVSPALDRDRGMEDDIQRVAGLIASGRLHREVEAAIG